MHTHSALCYLYCDKINCETAMNILIRHSFLPVGQGIFSTGGIHSDAWGGRVFNWVYDCGSVKENLNILNLEIDRIKMFSTFQFDNERPKLNVVFISHFDTDHISGLIKLLNNFDVDTLVIPYIPTWKRIVLTITSSSFNDLNFQHFMTNPLSFIESIESCHVRKVIFVPPSDKTAPDDNDDLFDGPSQRLEDSPILEADETNDLPEDLDILVSVRSSRIAVTTLQPGGRLVLNRFWEFVPYNEPTLKVKATPHFRVAAKNYSNTLIQTNDPSIRTKTLLSLKRLYERTFGSSSRKKNEISLFLYSGPTGRRTPSWKKGIEFSRLKLFDYPCSIDYCDLCTISFEQTSYTCSILYTGDGYLSSKERVRKLRDFFGEKRLENLDIFQVMHHGSHDNWKKGIAAQFTPNESIFCADPNYKYKHPNKDVMSDFSLYNPVTVNNIGISRFYELIY